ncbi:MAG: BTAD domain-containing putative transcriptional regulator [Solirubrobacteraceae bacterium]
MRFGILGPLEVADEGGRGLVLGGRRQRSVLAILLLHANEVVSPDRLIEELWSGQPPASAATSLHAHVSRLRRALGEERRIVTAGGGYLIRVADGELDRDRFERLVEEGAGAISRGDWELASGSVREALSLWRGLPLSDFRYDSFAQAEIARLEELHIGAVERRIEAELALGRDAQVVGDLERLVREHPYRERLRGQLMLALYRTGRQADALAAYQAARRTLVEELGIEPSAELRELEQGILRHDPSLSTPAPRAPPLAAGHLPVPATTFLGRARELAEVTALLGDADRRLLTLTGAGGSGKTRLALRVAQTCAAKYRDGTWFVGFADITDPGLIVPTISQTLELAEQAGLAPVRRLERWLAERQVLLVLDNLEQLAEGGAVLTEMLSACPGWTLLVTSREPLRLAGEQQYEVPVLNPQDAVELFTTRGKAVKPGIEIDPELARGICERVDCLPLAIELAAARTKALAPGEILARLDARLPLLTGGPRDAPRRQQTLKATIDWSYELLDHEQRRLFACMAVFAGGCALVAAEAVCGAELDTLHALVDRSLLRTDGERYWMLPTLREYGRERLEQRGEAEELRRLHARWFVGLIHSEGLDAHAPFTPPLLNHVRAERENFRGALEWAAEQGDTEALARLAYPLTFYWWVSEGQLQEAQRWVGMALEHLAEYPPWLRVGVLEAATNLASLRGEQKQALAFSEQALAILPQVGDPNFVCDVMMTDGILASQRGDLDHARAAMEDVARFAREHNLLLDLSGALVNLGDIAIEQGRLDEGRALLEEALASSEGGRSTTRSVALVNLAEIAALQGRYRDAASIGRTALAVALDHGDQLRAVWATFPISWALVELGELERAERLIGAATTFLQNAGFARSRSDLLCEEAVLDVLHRRLPADAVHMLVQQGRDTPLEEVLADALEDTART